MIDEVHTVRFGRDATSTLGAVVARAKRGRALAPVTVLVPSNLAGLTTRRTLATGFAGGEVGLVNIGFVTPLGLGERLAADILVDRRMLTDATLASGVRRALATDPRPFGEVADHAATEAAAATMYRHLAQLTPSAIEAVRGDAWGAVAVELFQRIAWHVAGFHDHESVVESVAARADLATAVDPLGHVVWYLPRASSPAQLHLIAAVLRAAPSSVVVGLTGDAEADRRVLEVCRRAGVDTEHAAAGSGAHGRDRDHELPAAPVADAIVSVSDPDEEVRAVVRRIMTLAAEGVRLDRVGVFYPVAQPYVRIIEQQLRAAGLVAGGPVEDPLAHSVAGRVVRAALALPDEQWRRDRLLALAAGAPVRGTTGGMHPHRWEQVSRAAGVVRGLGDWQHKLDAYQRAAARQVAAGHQSSQVDHDAAAALLDFVNEVAALVGAVRTASTWADKAAATRTLLGSLLGTDADRHDWPERERDDLERVAEAVDRLAALDEIEPRPAHAVFRRALETELDTPRASVQRYGAGIAYGPLSSAPGQDLDAVFVLGMAEGLCPFPRRDDALLPERVRALTGGELAGPDDLMADQHQALLAALAAAPVGRRVLTFPRGELRSSRRSLPSRWLLHSASALAGYTVHSTDFADLRAPGIEVVASFAAGMTSDDHASTIDERDTAAMASAATPAQHPALEPVSRAIAMQRARRSSAFTEFDGNLGAQSIPSPADDEVLSATRLERWASCGFRYFLTDILKVGVRDDPELIVNVSAIDRGSAMHETLERFLTEVIAAGVPEPGTPWSAAWRQRLHEIGDECFDALEARGRVGRALRWRLERARLHDLLDDFIAVDDEHRRLRGTRPARVELPFGLDGAQPVELRLDDGRSVRFRGRADRVDIDDQGHHVVVDYKTGRGRKYAKLAQPDPVLEGTTLQLGLYAEAARQHLGASSMSGWYWLLEAARPAERFAGYPWTDEHRARFMEVLHTIIEGIECGVFAQSPGEWNIWRRSYDNCAYCEFDTLCPVGRGEQADAKRHDPALAVRAPLTMEPIEGDEA